MAAEVYQWRIVYDGLEDKVWRIAEVSSNYRLDQLGYMVLAAFEAMGNHLFEFAYGKQRYGFFDDEELDEDAGVIFSKLSQLHLIQGDKLKMTYDFGANHVFNLELLAVEPMGKGQGKKYPLIVNGAGSGIIEDVCVDEVKELVEQIDMNGCTDEPIFYPFDCVKWDYRDFDLKVLNALLKGEIERIQEGYLMVDDGDE